jgi:hypothetical protein
LNRWRCFPIPDCQKKGGKHGRAKTCQRYQLTQLFSTIELIKKKPDMAKFKFRATNKWVDGTHNQAMIKDFYGAGKEDNSRTPTLFELDEPPVLCGRNIGPNPVEYLLAALKGYRYGDVYYQTQGGRGTITQLVSHWKIKDGVAEATDVLRRTIIGLRLRAGSILSASDMIM